MDSIIDLLQIDISGHNWLLDSLKIRLGSERSDWCLTLGQIVRYTTGQTSGHEAKMIKEHLDQCLTCEQDVKFALDQLAAESGD